MNFITICTPNSLHYEHALYSINNGKNVLIEKPVDFSSEKVKKLVTAAKKNNVNCFCVLQVRLNNSVDISRRCLDKKLLGKIRGVSFVQRWQRPYEYFSGWRNIPEVGGGTLYEVGIHYAMNLYF